MIRAALRYRMRISQKSLNITRASKRIGGMPFEAANKIEKVARDSEKVAPQSGAYFVSITRRDRCNLCYVFFLHFAKRVSLSLSLSLSLSSTPIILLIELNLIARFNGNFQLELSHKIFFNFNLILNKSILNSVPTKIIIP